jgi:tetratricopeptide (TPR) repeat protein
MDSEAEGTKIQGSKTGNRACLRFVANRRQLVLLLIGTLAVAPWVDTASSAQTTAQPVTASVLFQRAQALEKELERAETDNDRERILLGLASLYRQLHRYDRAIESYEQIRGMEGFAESPNRQTVLFNLGALHETRGRLEAAVEAYQEFLSQQVEEGTSEESLIIQRPVLATDLQVQRRLVSCFLQLGRPSEAKQILVSLAGVESPQQARYAIHQLVAMYERGNLSDLEVGDIADLLLSRFPEEAVRLAEVLLQRKRRAAARYFYDELLRESPEKLLPAAETVALFYQSEDSLDQMIEELEQIASPSINTVKLLVRLHRFGGNLERAEELLETYLEKEKAPELMREIGDLRMASGDYAGSAEAYESYLQAIPGADSEAYRKLGEAYILDGSEEQALKAWGRIVQVAGNTPRAYLELSEILDQYGFSQAAIEMMEQATARAPSSALYAPRLMNLYLKNGRFDEAIEQLIRLNRSFIGLDRVMADAILKAVNTPETESELLKAAQAVLEKTPAKQGDILLDIIFQIHLRSGDFDAAIRQIQRIPGTRGEIRLYVLGQSLRDFGELSAAADALGAISATSPYFASSRLEAMEALMEAGDYERALHFGVEVTRKITESVSATAAVAEASPDLFAIFSDIVVSSSAWDAGRRSELERLLISLGDLWVREKNGRAALASLLLAAKVPTRDRRVSSHVLRRLGILTGHAYALLGDYRNARLMYQTASQWAGPSNDEAQFMLAELDLWEGEVEKAQAAYENLLQLDLSRALVNEVLERIYFLSQLSPDETKTYADANRFAWQGRWEDAIDRFRTLAARRTEDHITHWCLFAIGEILAAQGENEAARQEWERLLEKTEDLSLEGRIRLGVLELGSEVPSASPELILQGYRQIIEDMPESIFADEARRRLSES